MTHAPSLDIRAVSKTYRVAGRVHEVLRNVSFSVGRQEILGIVGASGCGKSTLLRLIVGLDRDFDGAIEIEGRPLATASRRVGIVFQDHRLYPWLTAAENVDLALDASGLGPAERRERVRHHLDLVGLADFAQAYPRQLSGGMTQRAAIARALAQEPDILLMDEPFGALDSLTRLRLQDELLRIWERRRTTLVIVTHDVEEALHLADRVLVMEPHPGRIRTIMPVDLSRPRDRASTRLAAQKADLLNILLSAA